MTNGHLYLVGIGGGELMGPLFLTYHLLPPVSTATTSMMSLINTGNNIVHYAIAGESDFVRCYSIAD